MDNFIVDGFSNKNFEKSENKSNYKTITKDNIVFINSIDRNYNYDTNYNFSINFTSTNLSNAYVNKDFKNITKIELVDILIQNIYINVKEALCLYNKGIISSSTTANSNNIRLQRLSDMPYLLLNIQDLSNDNYGSNKEINKSTFTLILDDNFDNTSNNSGVYTLNGSNKYVEYGNIGNNILANTDKKTLKYKYIENTPISYFPGVKNNLKNLKFSFYTPYGELLTNLSDKLIPKTIKKVTTSGDRIRFKFDHYFTTDEYDLGDTILFKNISINDSTIRNTALQEFLMRPKGHSIINFSRETTVDNASDPSKLYNYIDIPFDYDLDLSISNNAEGGCSVKDDYGLTTSEISLNSGVILNTNLRNIIVLKISYEKRDNILLHSNIIN